MSAEFYIPLDCRVNVPYLKGHRFHTYRVLESKLHQPYLTRRISNTSLAAKGPLAHRLQRRTAAPPAKSKMAARGPQNGGRGLERCLPLGFWAF